MWWEEPPHTPLSAAMDTAVVALIMTSRASLAIAVPCLIITFLCHHRGNHKVRNRQRCPSSWAASQQQLSVFVVAGATDSSSWSFYGPVKNRGRTI